MSTAKAQLSRVGAAPLEWLAGGLALSLHFPLPALVRDPAAGAATLKPMPNALASQTSPYLRQHAENPVDWLPWGPRRWRRRASATCRWSCRSATPPATGAT